jgi:hypothetical protein
MRPATKYDVRERQGSPRCNIEAKWKVGGQTWREDPESDILVEVEYLSGADYRDMKAAFGHERGHAGQMSDDPSLTPGSLSPNGRFWVEVQAWERSVAPETAMARTIDLREGQLILDCINAYRRHLDVSDGEWTTAREIIESWCDDDRLSGYEPLEPEEGDESPCTLMEETLVFTAKGSGSPPDQEEKSFWGENTRERDAWLATAEGQAVAAHGKDTLRRVLRQHGWDEDNLPPLTVAIMRGEGT